MPHHSVEEYITANNLSGKEIEGILSSIDSTAFKEVCTRTVKNVDTYSFSAELSDETARGLFGKVGNVIFEFSEAKFEVTPVKLTASYGDTSKMYDGLEAKLALDSSNVVLTGTGFNTAALSVVSANFKYNDNGAAHVKCGKYYFTGSVVQITAVNSENVSEDVSKNFTVAPFQVSVEITKRPVLARSSQAVINYPVASTANSGHIDDLIEELMAGLYSSIDFEGRVDGDVINNSDFELYSDGYDTSTNTATVYVKSFNNDCYTLENMGANAVLITIYVTKV